MSINQSAGGPGPVSANRVALIQVKEAGPHVSW